MRSAVRRFGRERSAIAGVIIVACVVLGALLGPLLDGASPIAIDHALMGSPTGPSLAHLLGTDLLGRDELARAFAGARVSLTVGVTAMLIAISLGTVYGAIAGAAGGVVDTLMMRLVDALLAFPSFFLIITVEALTEKFALLVIILIIGLLSWMGVARLVRGEVLSLRGRDYVQAAIATGQTHRWVIWHEILPNALSPLIVLASLMVATAILLESSLSFLGLGDPNLISWGYMVGAGRTVIRQAWWITVFPGLAILLSVLGLNLIGEGLNDALNPRLSREGGR